MRIAEDTVESAEESCSSRGNAVDTLESHCRVLLVRLSGCRGIVFAGPLRQTGSWSIASCALEVSFVGSPKIPLMFVLRSSSCRVPWVPASEVRSWSLLDGYFGWRMERPYFVPFNKGKSSFWATLRDFPWTQKLKDPAAGRLSKWVYPTHPSSQFARSRSSPHEVPLVRPGSGSGFSPRQNNYCPRKLQVCMFPHTSFQSHPQVMTIVADTVVAAEAAVTIDINDCVFCADLLHATSMEILWPDTIW